jgi:hypothetical protein
MTGPLSSDQVNRYLRDGYILVSGLVPEDVAARAETHMWRLLRMNPRDRATWEPPPPVPQNFPDPEITAFYTDAVLAAAEQLAEAERPGGEPDAPYVRPKVANALNIFPRSGAWDWPGPHIDHSIPKDGHRSFPRAYRMATMAYLSDGAPHGGNTVVWPGSSAKIKALAESDRGRFALASVLGAEIGKADIGKPVELVPRRGDILFYPFWCAHAGSANVSDRPRLALNAKW